MTSLPCALSASERCDVQHPPQNVWPHASACASVLGTSSRQHGHSNTSASSVQPLPRVLLNLTAGRGTEGRNDTGAASTATMDRSESASAGFSKNAVTAALTSQLCCSTSIAAAAGTRPVMAATSKSALSRSSCTPAFDSDGVGASRAAVSALPTPAPRGVHHASVGLHLTPPPAPPAATEVVSTPHTRVTLPDEQRPASRSS
mmetsp:Transcript_2581/g.8873  ORF Transcript_2581/g.8873 Transcript_2581/m.8873 type:complete len:203 (-) Transcript_2581:3452-4060(-)